MLQIFKRQSRAFQYFSTIYYTICDRCLDLHGKIIIDPQPDQVPPLHEGCNCSLLKIEGRTELKYHKELGKRMEERAKQEMQRRKLFREAVQQLSTDPETAYELFRQSGNHQFYIEELEEFSHLPSLVSQTETDFTKKLYKLFINLNRFQYDQDRYHHVPPRMKMARIEHGEKIIQSLFEAGGLPIGQQRP